MPYLHLDLPGTYPVPVKRELATRLCKLHAELMETQLWRPNVGIAELGFRRGYVRPYESLTTSKGADDVWSHHY